MHKCSKIYKISKKYANIYKIIHKYKIQYTNMHTTYTHIYKIQNIKKIHKICINIRKYTQ